MVDFAGEILRDVLARAIVDDEIQLDLISDQNQKMKIEEMIKFVEARESSKRSASRLLDAPSVNAARVAHTAAISNRECETGVRRQISRNLIRIPNIHSTPWHCVGSVRRRATVRIRRGAIRRTANGVGNART